eukprot:824917_1
MCWTHHFHLVHQQKCRLCYQPCFRPLRQMIPVCIQHAVQPFSTFHPTSGSPTKSPTIVPTAVPTVMPTRRPTEHPTRTPSYIPTLVPSRHPTRFPTSSPTPYPTALPSKIPTLRPSHHPTAQPTSYPNKTSTALIRATISTTSLQGARGNDEPKTKNHTEAIFIFITVISPIMLLLCVVGIILLFRIYKRLESFSSNEAPHSSIPLQSIGHQNGTCILCCERKANMFNDPCGHVTYCDTCANNALINDR